MPPVLEIRTPQCEFGIGSVITRPDAVELIDGVKVQPYSFWADDRGHFLEVARLGRGLTADFPPESTQVSSALTFPGAIKAFHFHRHQRDLWCVVQGMFQVALVDLRPDSPAFGRKNTFYVGQMRPWQILIPPGVGHGYKVIGMQHATLVYLTDRFYNPEDEGRIPYNDKGINYDWELQHK